MKTVFAIIMMLASISSAYCGCTSGNCAPLADDSVNLEECQAFPERDNWFTCTEGKVTSIVHKEPDVTQIILIAEERKVIWVHEKARIYENRIEYSVADDCQDDGIIVKTKDGIVTYMDAW